MSAALRAGPADGWRWAVARTREILRREGPAGLVFRVLARLGYRRNGWFVRSLAEPVEEEPRAPVEVVELTAADVEAYLSFRRGATAASFHERLGRGARCHAALRDGRIASVTWTSTGSGRIEFLDRAFSLAPDEVYLFDSFTRPEHRGQRLQAALCARVLAGFRAAGYRVAITMIAPENRPNIRSRMRSGFVRTGTMGRVGVGRWTRHFFRGRRRPGGAAP